ncbi:MAG TPA: hypothetical protein VFA26_15000 [Gemmataceae bacterium]|nr:hypothetical protein [Gemmataceae bacterium]
MRRVGRLAADFLRDENGATTTEHAIVVALIGLGLIGRLGPLVTSATGSFSKASNPLAAGS